VNSPILQSKSAQKTLEALLNPTSVRVTRGAETLEDYFMFAKMSFVLTAFIALEFVNPACEAQDPYVFQFGYTLGYQNSFRNRLPTPPYFSVFPPVYYGKRFERPYGDSPYASFPQLRSAPDYYAVPKDAPIRTRSVSNPHVEQGARVESKARNHDGEPVAVMPPRIGRTVEVINPFVRNQFVTR
jgi:hypothetical protein